MQESAMMEEKTSSMPRTAHQIYLHDHLQRLHNEIESTTRKLELEKRRLNKLEEDVTRMRVEHDEKVIKAASRAPPGPSMRKLEHRLAKAIAQLNALGHDNKDVRDKIDAIRRERLQMNQVFKKLQADIKENISSVSQLQRETDGARREQDERQHRMAALKKQIEIERRQFKNTVTKLQKDMKKEEIESLQDKVLMVREGSHKDENDGGKSSRTRSLKADEEENFNSPAVMRRILKLAFLNAIQRRHIRQHQKNIEVFEQAFATIKSTTGIHEIEEIVKIFVVLEQRNFSLLTYVNMLNREIESFEKQNSEFEEQIRSHRRSEHESDKKRTDVLAELKQQIQSTSKVIEENQLQTVSQSEVFERCRPMIQQILKTVEKENRGFGGQPAPEFSADNVLAWLTYIEKTLTQWKDFLPDTKDTRHYKAPNKNYKYTVGNQVLALQPKKPQNASVSLVKAGELPSAANAILDQQQQQRGAALAGREEDSDTDEEELQNHPWTRQELRDKAIASVAKRKKHRKTDVVPGASQQPGGATLGMDAPRADEAGVAATGAAAEAELNYDDIIEKKGDADDESLGSDDSDLDDDAGPTDDEINEIFLKRYKMSREELQGMADKMGIQLNNLCYLKQEFDAYDEDRSGYIDVKELKGLLEKLGEELSDEELDQAFRELDSDGSGEIEFFEFVEWFTSED